ncbi:Alpha/Beta hydrolase protein [Polychytrium aggregatum]|uniref:Alpha/Beta hydrolase protein n=1 Tax=Polychytrium aggregatum TaxID=110093 RepID=UPI0022FE5F32|nr:Alpha/Beta hydrolase protein [Polychytrium aggregatum]KAI9209883.1 Alpha/Beta hydrolase protein [Polychytrium aggregatum]
MNSECCTLPPCSSDYVAKGSEIVLGDLPAYITGDKQSTKAIVFVYDIFGYHPNTKQVADLLASRGFFVIMPDFFRGEPWNTTPFEMAELVAFLGKRVPPEVIERDTQTAVEYLKAQGVTSIGSVGLCWGGLQTFRGGIAGHFAAVASAHPSMLNADIARALNIPACLLPSKTDADFTEFFEILNAKPFGAKNVHQRFDDMHHGWCGARSDFADPLNAQRTSEAVSILAKFFHNTL